VLHHDDDVVNDEADGRGDAAKRALPMSPEDLLEAAVLVYLRGLGLTVPTTG